MEYMLLIAEIVVLESEMIILVFFFLDCFKCMFNGHVEVSLDSLTFMVDFGVIIAYPVPRVFFDPSV